MRMVILAAILLAESTLLVGQTGGQPSVLLKKYLKLTDTEIARIGRGEAVAKELPSATPETIYIVGAVHINAAPEDYLNFALDMNRLRTLNYYVGIGRLSDPPQLSELEGFTLEQEDIQSLKNCKPGNCDVQLPEAAMSELMSINWAVPTAEADVAKMIRGMAIEAVGRYSSGGDQALGVYRDHMKPLYIAEQLKALLDRNELLPAYLPELNRYLMEYPNSELPGSESIFYWEKVNFGLKPTLRLNHAVTYRASAPFGLAQVVAVKQLYASHYFQVAMDLTACITDNSRGSDPGFFLISVKSSRQDGLTGFLGSLLRRVVVSKTRLAQERNLDGVKKALEKK